MRGKTEPEIVIIAALAEKDRVIGRGMDLPWRIPEDLRRFKRLTAGHPLLMGRKTFESIVHQFGKPLADRRNVVLTRCGRLKEYPDIETYSGADQAMAALASEATVFIGGGRTIYEQFLQQADRLELTLVEGDYEGDTYFPPFEHLVGTVFDPIAVENRDGFRFVTYVRTRASGSESAAE